MVLPFIWRRGCLKSTYSRVMDFLMAILSTSDRFFFAATSLYPPTRGIPSFEARATGALKQRCRTRFIPIPSIPSLWSSFFLRQTTQR